MIIENGGITDTKQILLRKFVKCQYISVWEVAKLVEYKRLKLSISLDEWIDKALHYPGLQKVELSTEIIIQSTRLKGEFHKDTADQIIVATSNITGIPLLTADDKILSYPNVKLAR